MVRAAVDFLRVECVFADDFFLAVDDADEEAFFLLEEVPLAGFLAGADDASWAGNPLLCSNSNAARLKEVTRFGKLTRFSVTRLGLRIMKRPRC